MDPPDRHGDRGPPPPTPPSATPGSPPTSAEPGSAPPVAVSAGSLPRHSSVLSLWGGSLSDPLNPFAAPFSPSSAAGTSRRATLEGLRFSDSDEDDDEEDLLWSTRRPKLDSADKGKGKEVAQSPSRRCSPPPQVAPPAPSDFMAAARLPAPIRAPRVGVPTQAAALTTTLLHNLNEAEKSSYVRAHINTYLREDPFLKEYLPIDPTGNQLFDLIRDGVLLCKLINVAVPGTIDERAINKERVLSSLERNENHTLCLNSAKAIGCTVVNIGTQDLVEGRPHLVLGLISQIIKIQLLADLNLKKTLQLVELFDDSKDIDEVLSLSPEKVLPQSQSEMPKQTKPSWSDLHIDIMGKLMEYLNSLEDRASLGAVCRNWRACVEVCWLAPAYLLLPGGMMYRYPDFTPRYLNGSEGYSGSCQGYLLFRQSGGVDGPRHLLKYPFFRGGIPWSLPRLFAAIRGGGSDGGSLLSQWWNDAKTMDVRKLVMCSDNTIAAILGSEYFARVAIYWTSRHLWFLADDQFRCYEDLAFCDGRLYALTGMEELWAFDIGNVNDGVSAAELVIRGPLPGHRMSAARYLVRSCASNALLMIRRQLELWPSHQNAQVSVFRADLASSQWVEVTDLGREALLVGRLCSRAMPVPAHNMEGTLRNVVKGNTILFATVDRVALASLQGVAIYDMRNGVVTLRQVILTNQGPDSATWLFPHEERLR